MTQAIPLPDVKFISFDQFVNGLALPGQVPVINRLDDVGAGSYERAFCILAHQCVRGEVTPMTAIAGCAQCHATMCGLTNDEAPCLFTRPDDPIWDDIRYSERIGSALREAQLID